MNEANFAFENWFPDDLDPPFIISMIGILLRIDRDGDVEIDFGRGAKWRGIVGEIDQVLTTPLRGLEVCFS